MNCYNKWAQSNGFEKMKINSKYRGVDNECSYCQLHNGSDTYDIVYN